MMRDLRGHGRRRTADSALSARRSRSDTTLWQQLTRTQRPSVTEARHGLATFIAAARRYDRSRCLTRIPLLRLDAPREEVLDQATSIMRAAWKSFDQRAARAAGARRRRAAAARLCRCRRRRRGQRGAAGHRAGARRVDRARRGRATSPSSARPGSRSASSPTRSRPASTSTSRPTAARRRPSSARCCAGSPSSSASPGRAGAVTSGGTVSNITALARRPRARRAGRAPARPARRLAAHLHAPSTRTTPWSARSRCSASARDGMVALPVDAQRRLDVAALDRAIEADRADGATPIAVVANGGSTLAGAVDPLDGIADVCAAPRRLAARRRRLRPAGRGHRRAPATCSAGSSAPTRSPSTRTSGSTCRRPAASCWCATSRRSRRPSRTTPSTCCAPASSGTRSTSRWSTRGPSAR